MGYSPEIFVLSSASSMSFTIALMFSISSIYSYCSLYCSLSLAYLSSNYLSFPANLSANSLSFLSKSSSFCMFFRLLSSSCFLFIYDLLWFSSSSTNSYSFFISRWSSFFVYIRLIWSKSRFPSGSYYSFFELMLKNDLWWIIYVFLRILLFSKSDSFIRWWFFGVIEPPYFILNWINFF